MKLEEILNNLQQAVKRYEEKPLDDLLELSEVLRTLGVNLSALVHVRDEYYNRFQSIVYNSTASSVSKSKAEAEFKTPELDLIRKVLQHYTELQKDIRSQISLRKNLD